MLGVLKHPDADDLAANGPTGNIVRSAPGRAVPALYWHAEPDCDHCKLPRRRKETVIIENAAGDLLQVGRSCLAEYTGSSDAEASIRAFLNWQEFWAHVRGASEGALDVGVEDEDEGAGGTVRVPAALSLADFLAWVIGCVRREGFVTKDMVGLDHPYTTGQCGMESGLDARKRGVPPRRRMPRRRRRFSRGPA
ncbi:hypothetical protein [Nannocystis pusilla]|uniref:hypothetical protein n=1 Tax=Nannocystis pusilla TaxID=889268 RepID=UPI003B7EF8CF